MMCSASDGAHVAGLEGGCQVLETALPGARRGMRASLLTRPQPTGLQRLRRFPSVAHGEYWPRRV